MLTQFMGNVAIPGDTVSGHTDDIYLQLFKNLYCRFYPISRYECPIKLHSCLLKLKDDS
jgi:hypothetical protein